jgi:hypothetical protein
MNVLLIIILIHIKSGRLIYLIKYSQEKSHEHHFICRSLRARDPFFDDATHDNKGRLQKQSEIF